MKLEFFPSPRPEAVSPADWHDWRWQMRRRLVTAEDFSRWFDLSVDEVSALAASERLFKVQSTPYYASLGARSIAADPIRQMILPSPKEFSKAGQQVSDPLGERHHSPVARLVHRYPDRVLFLVTDTCSVYCRFCLRKYFTGQDEALVGRDQYHQALEYIRAGRGIREVILSGGDALTLSDERLVQILKDLRAIPHVEIIRLATRMPVVCPMRITTELVRRLKEFHPVLVMTHFNHPRELTREAAEALAQLVDNGFPVFNQMVLLRGVNNHAAVVQALSRRLLYLRVKPYYMFQCDPSEGTDHFRTSIEESLAIQRELWGKLSGLAMPHLSLDIPGGGGKVPLVPNFVESRSSEHWSFRGWDRVQAKYDNPASESASAPIDGELYLQEWREICEQTYGLAGDSSRDLRL